ncbi:carboxypeptidase-like regulatory domain-containing protein [Marivirga tractuosa]|uniref:carboxypeptidase-like regulatory domain-containing protein n=1 Tax=Marivirga tractuosa TaxID=1006 RepID=UPI0035CF9128
MNKQILIIFLFLSLFISFELLSQKISGTVINPSGEPLTGASVYIDGTTIGDITDVNGAFSFKIKPEINAVLIVSFVGYKTLYLNKPSTEKPYTFQLEEDVSVMGEVKVYNNPFSRKQLMKAFKEQFIGDRRLQRECIILNEEDIRFRYNPESLIFSAFADQPLEIENLYLGYNITYNLIKFEVQFKDFSLKEDLIKSSLFSGTTQFKPLLSSKRVEKRRMKAYQNSSLSFFRALKASKLDENGFRLYHNGYRTSAKNLMDFQEVGTITKIKVKQQKRGFNGKNFVARFDILFNGKERSSVSFYTSNFMIDGYGLYSNFDKILFSGAISEKKMAMILPADFGM